MTSIYFDDALPILIEVVERILGVAALAEGTILRDATGRLSFISMANAPSDEERTRICKEVSDALGPYALPETVISYGDDPGAEQALADPLRLPIQVREHFCWLTDKRIVGSGWLDSPVAGPQRPPRIVFASLKGGVGRSTALAVAAADLARRGRNVLVVDLDLEAPGIGNLLLDEERASKYGVIDFLVENGIGGVSDTALADFVGLSALTSGSGGRVAVAPAIGTHSSNFPENILPKLSRAMLDDITEIGEVVPVATQIATMISRMTEQASYDAVLIDSRAGLAEISAPSILSLGATILLFGTAQKQTIQGYQGLFAGLKLLALRDRLRKGEADWRLLLKAVYAKATTFDELTIKRHREALYDLFADNLYDAETDNSLSSDDVSFDIDDQEAPHWPLMIPFSQSFVEFDPVVTPSQLTSPFYEQTFRPFLDGLDEILKSTAEEPGGQEGGAE